MHIWYSNTSIYILLYCTITWRYSDTCNWFTKIYIHVKMLHTDPNGFTNDILLYHNQQYRYIYAYVGCLSPPTLTIGRQQTLIIWAHKLEEGVHGHVVSCSQNHIFEVLRVLGSTSFHLCDVAAHPRPAKQSQWDWGRTSWAAMLAAGSIHVFVWSAVLCDPGSDGNSESVSARACVCCACARARACMCVLHVCVCEWCNPYNYIEWFPIWIQENLMSVVYQLTVTCSIYETNSHWLQNDVIQ